MNDTRRPHPDSRRPDNSLTRLLRDADPAGDAPALNPVERARMRQAVTDAVEHVPHGGTAGWAGWLQPALAAAAMIAAVGLGLWSLGDEPADAPGTVADGGGTASQTTPSAIPPPTSLDDSPGQVADDVAPTAVPTTPAAAPADVAGETAPPAASQPEAAPQAAPQASTETVAQLQATTVAAVDSPSPTERKSRTVQFTAPRGTRIIWTLDPNFEAPIAGREPGREQ